MSAAKINLGLARALALSHDMLGAAEKGDLRSLTSLDRERMELLKSFRNGAKLVSAADQALLQQINEINDRAIGLVEHQRRSKGRDLDMAAVGRRAVAAYADNRPRR
jgi:predicted MarR family transcription regulator